jgi:hypothetical protein
MFYTITNLIMDSRFWHYALKEKVKCILIVKLIFKFQIYDHECNL